MEVIRRALLALVASCAAAAPTPKSPALAASLRDAELGASPPTATATATPTSTSTPTPVPWVSTSFGAYLAPPGGLLDSSGGFDLLVHFHRGQSAGPDLVALHAPLLFATVDAPGLGSSPYRELFDDPTRFGALLEELTAAVRASTGRAEAHVRHLGLVAFSAGYGAVQQILRVMPYYASIDALVLLDGLHADYVAPKTPDLDRVDAIVQFAEDAARGTKLFVFTHTSIVPPGYASTSEMADALVGRTGGADVRGFHVLGYGGDAGKDHTAQLHLVDEVLAKWVLPAWR